MAWSSNAAFCCAVALMSLTTVNAFCQGKTNVVPGETDQITFDRITIYRPGNKTTKLCEAAGFTPHPCAHYWVNIALDVPANTQAKAKLTGSPDLLAFRRSVTYPGVDTMSNSGAVHTAYEGPREFGMYTGYAAAAPSAHTQAYMAGFSMDDLLAPLITFNVGSRRVQTTNGKITFDRVMIDTVGAWNTIDNSFTATQAGLYFFQYNVGTTTSTQRNVSFNVNGKERQQLVDGPKPTSITGGGATNGIDMISRCILTSLAKDDVVTLTFKGDKPYSDAEIQQTGFSGFFYHPTSSIQVAWSVSRTEPETAYRLITALTFDRVDVNVGAAWKSGKSYEAVIPVAGAYYLYLDVAACSSGAIQADVRVNDQTAFSVNHDVSDGPLGWSRGNGAIVHVYIGDKISVWTDKSTCVYGGPSGLTTFTGMLVQPCGMLSNMNSATFSATFSF